MLQYHLNSRIAKLGKNQGKTVFYAQARTRGTITFDLFCREVAEGSTVDVADVKAVLSRLHTVISRNIARGFSVEVGELGNFRPTFGSEEVLDPATFDVTQHVRRPKISFLPRRTFSSSLQANASFERIALPEGAKGKKSKAAVAPTPTAPAGGHGTEHAAPGTPAGGDEHLGI